MAEFQEAYSKTMSHEGGYSHDPDDAGGETYKGIARKYNGSWSGWDIIDHHREESDFPSCLDKIVGLQNSVHSFYKEKYWDVNKLDDVDSQALAEEMFDTGVNMGVGRAAKFLQKSLNYLNRNGSLYEDLSVDGAIGPASLGALKTVLRGGDEDVLLKMMNTLQGQHYMNYMDSNPVQKKYARGWFSRVSM
ncbi:MAG: glycoside hydrolase family 108 protein [Candidatus Heimdallarchaeaceae archaeon]